MWKSPFFGGDFLNPSAESIGGSSSAFTVISPGDPAGQASELGVKAGMLVPWLKRREFSVGPAKVGGDKPPNIYAYS